MQGSAPVLAGLWEAKLRFSSAAKVLTSTLFGAAIQAGVPLSARSRVYQVMNGGTFANDLEPRKRALTVEHLLTMSSGLAGRPLPELFHELVAQPLGIRRYWMNLTPTGEAYMGGGVRLLPRDFMKPGQLMLDGGTWRGRRIVSEQWAKRATSPLVSLGGIKYGYLWWVMEYPYQGRTVQAFFAGGNGGQVVMGIPQLDLVVTFYGGNYSDAVMFQSQRRLIPEYVLPAVVGKF